MKTRFKVITILVCFVAFYFALIPILQSCVDASIDCSILQELVLLTRPVIHSAENDMKWSGTADGTESPSAEFLLVQNIPFIVSMIVLPFVIIGFVVTLDRTKSKKTHHDGTF